MVKERDGEEEELNILLDKAERGEDVWADRIHQTLQIDGETHPDRDQVRQELKTIHGRRKPRTSRPKTNPPPAKP